MQFTAFDTLTSTLKSPLLIATVQLSNVNMTHTLVQATDEPHSTVALLHMHGPEPFLINMFGVAKDCAIYLASV